MTASSKTRNWIYDREPGSIFWVTDVPGEPALRNQVCSRLTKGDEPYLERVSQGLYYKYEFAGDPGIDTSQRIEEALFELAGPGGGPFDLYVLNLFGWANPSSCWYTYTTQKKRPPVTPGIPNVRWTVVDLPHRLDLTQSEVALIEATRHWVETGDMPWETALEDIYHGDAFFCLPKRYEIRSDAIAEAIPYEVPLEIETRWTKLNGFSSPQCAERLDNVVGALRAAGR